MSRLHNTRMLPYHPSQPIRALFDSSNCFYRCFYAGEKGNPNDLDKSFLRSALLLKMWASIFTPQSSAEHINEHKDEGLDSEPPTKKRRGANKKCTKGNVTLPNKEQEQEQVLVPALAVEASRWRLLGRGLCVFVFVFVFEEDRRGQREESPGSKVAVQIVDVDVEPRTEMGRKVSDNCSDMCSVAAILEESMKNLTLGKK